MSPAIPHPMRPEINARSHPRRIPSSRKETTVTNAGDGDAEHDAQQDQQRVHVTIPRGSAARPTPQSVRSKSSSHLSYERAAGLE